MTYHHNQKYIYARIQKLFGIQIVEVCSVFLWWTKWWPKQFGFPRVWTIRKPNHLKHNLKTFCNQIGSDFEHLLFTVKTLSDIIFQSSQDSSVGSTLDWYSEGLGFKSRRLQLNFQLEKGCWRDSKQYTIKYGRIALNLN